MCRRINHRPPGQPTHPPAQLAAISAIRVSRMSSSQLAAPPPYLPPGSPPVGRQSGEALGGKRQGQGMAVPSWKGNPAGWLGPGMAPGVWLGARGWQVVWGGTPGLAGEGWGLSGGVSVWQLSLVCRRRASHPKPTPLRSPAGRRGRRRRLRTWTGLPTPTPPNPPTKPPASQPQPAVRPFQLGTARLVGRNPPKVQIIFPSARGIRSHLSVFRSVPARRPPTGLEESGLGDPHLDGSESENPFSHWGPSKRHHREKRQTHSLPPGPTLYVCCVTP